jgi:epoxyqueuosine reductase QueG
MGMDHDMISATENFRRAEAVLAAEGAHRGLKHAVGAAPFKAVHDTLLPTQKQTLEGICGEAFNRLMEEGSVISIAFAYKPYAIEAIARGSEGHWDRERWNTYSRAYARLNNALNYTSAAIAGEIGGIAIPATIDSYTKANTVEEYYATRVSHRVAAELSGVGWRGKHELIVSPLYGPAIRLASIVAADPISRTPPASQSCGDCRACLDACPILANKKNLANYREQCRSYLAYLALEDEVCGKCIKACVKDGKYSAQFSL